MRLPWFLSASASLTLFLLLEFVVWIHGERDFNVNDSQVPVIEPKDVPAYKQDPYVTELMSCQNAPSEIVLSLLLKKHDWSELTATKRAHVQAKLAKFFAIPKEFISLDSVSKRELKSMHKLAMRKGGKGNKNIETLNRRLGRASFMIGCGPSYFVMGEPIAKQIAHQMKDGTIGALTEENFGLWFIWRKELKSRSNRKRRQSEGSGADEDDYDYGDDDEEVAEPSTEVPPVTTHAHRHHHGALEVSEKIVSPESVSSSAVPLVPDVQEEIEESVSKLESVISKTIENTKNIKELPVLGEADDGEDEEEVELQQLGVPLAAEIAPEETTSAAATRATEMVKPVDLEEHEIQVDSGAVPAIDVEASATSTPPMSAPETLKPFSPYDASSSVSSSSSPVASIATGSEAGEDSTSVSTPHLSPANSPTVMPTELDRNGLATTSSSSLSASPPSPSAQDTQPTTSASASYSSPSSTTTSTTATVSTTTTASSTATTTTTTTTTLSESPKQPNTVLNELELSTLLPIEDFEGTATATHPTVTASATAIASTAATAAATATTATATATASATPAGESEFHIESTTHRTISSKEGEPDAISSSSSSNNNNNSLANNELSTPATPTSSVATTTAATPESSSSGTFVSTDYMEPQPEENSPPIIKTRLQKLAVTSGKAFTFHVLPETFYDAEDQGNLRLALTDKDGHELKANSWLQFNADKRELYGLPLDDTVSRWQYRLSATDSGNASVTETVEISVQQHRAVRTINHEISVFVRINEKPGHNIDWQLKLINAVARTLDDSTNSAVVVREIRQTPHDPHSATLVYFNETLPTSECPEKELKDIVARLDANRLSDLVLPQLGIKSITGQLIGSCQKDLTQVKPTQHMAKNVPPMPRNQVDRVNASLGQLLVYKVPADTFYDANDNQLTLTLKTRDHLELSPRHWLQFDSKNEEFYGIPKSGDIGSEEYLLVAEDSGGLSAHDALVVVVSPAPKRDFGFFFKAYLSIKHERFNADLQRKFVERVAKLNGDATTGQIQIRSITTHHDSDGTIVNFYNTTLYRKHNSCREKEVAMTRSVYLNSDLSLREAAKRALGPELNLTNFSVVPFSICHLTANIDTNQLDYIPSRPEEPTHKSSFGDDYMITFVWPIVIIVTMLVAASIIACCLHWCRQRSGKMELGDEEERKSFRAKGIPVIFQDEYEEKPEIGNKSPVILKDEKPPLLPPSYNTSNLNGDNDVDDYVPPPSVVVGGREVRGKSPATPSYRKPPPYVSP
ncbi:dystroglycan isoform X1 [Drosophila yakuba]|uniref:dystroglycan isoform X1 n=1 Tax=Drosophila yakuba TaxID=7245 RepID=UPI0019308069|nr:dystroglycan isoform X1 [Drosophila yakuba]